MIPFEPVRVDSSCLIFLVLCMRVLKAKVKDGRLVLDEPTELPEGTEVDLILADDVEVEFDTVQLSAIQEALKNTWDEVSAPEPQAEAADAPERSE